MLSAMAEILVMALIVAVHVLGGGVWIGAMAFSVLVLHPRAEQFFHGGAQLEDFIFTVVHGARWKVVAGIAAIVGSGAWLALRGWSAGGPLWQALVLVKLGLLAISLGLFVHVSWGLWPRRVLSAAHELPAVRRRFWWVGVVMIVCNSVNLGLGVVTAGLQRAH